MSDRTPLVNKIESLQADVNAFELDISSARFLVEQMLVGNRKGDGIVLLPARAEDLRTVLELLGGK